MHDNEGEGGAGGQGGKGSWQGPACRGGRGVRPAATGATRQLLLVATTTMQLAKLQLAVFALTRGVAPSLLAA